MKILETTSKKTAILLSYCHLAVQTLSTMLLTSLFIRMLGVEEYGFYQMIYSVANYILILDLGISATMVRFVSEYRARDDKQKEENFAAHMLILAGVLILAVVAVGVVVNRHLGDLYPLLTPEDLRRGHTIFHAMIFQISVVIASHYVQGIALSYERFSAVRLISILQVAVYFISAVLLVQQNATAISIVRANTIAIVSTTVLMCVYDKTAVAFSVRWHGWDFQMLIPAFTLMLAMLLQSVISYVNTSLDKTLLGMYASKADVTVYAVAATVISLYNALPSAISSVFLPQITKAVVQGADNETLTDAVIRAGRYQCMLCCGVLGGFFLLGKEFIRLWTGADTTDAWVYALVIMVPNTIPLIQNVCLSILDAKNKRIFRSLILASIVLANIGVSIAMIQSLGAIGAPLATGLCYVVGHGILMNVYYKKKIGLNVGRMFGAILKGTLPCAVGAAVLCGLVKRFAAVSTWMGLAVNGGFFCLVYGVLLLCFALNAQEKQEILAVVNRIKR